MKDSGANVRIGIELALDPPTAFGTLTDELSAALSRRGIVFQPGADGVVTEGKFEVGRVAVWQPGERILLRWHPADWEPGETTEVELQLQPLAKGGTRVTLEHRGWGRFIGSPEELAGWFAEAIAGPLLSATSPAAHGDWITDRRAR